jgi:hypothetical protein
MKRFISFGYIAMLVGGLVLATGSLVEGLNRPGDPFSAQVTTSAFALSAALRLTGAALALMGIVAICVRQADRAGRFGLVAYVLVVVNMVMQLGSMWCDLFVTDMLSRHAPALLDDSNLQGRLGVGFMMAWLLNATFILLGIATLRAKVFGRVVGWSLLAVGVITLLPLPFDGPWFEVLIGLAFAVTGWFARSAGTEVESRTASVTSDLAASTS